MKEAINPENLFYLESEEERRAENTSRAGASLEKSTAASYCKLQNAIDVLRESGHLSASFNPLEEEKQAIRWEHTYEGLGFTDEERNVLFPTFGLFDEEALPLETIIANFQSIYTNRIGIEYAGFVTDDVACWIQDRFEKLGGRVPIGKEQKRAIYQQLVHAELFEWFLGIKHVGQKRFSLEGAETVIPMLAFFMERCCQHEVETVVLGMAHRGRLNVLANVLMKPLSHLFAEFDEQLITVADAGDVKYHKGYVSTASTISNRNLSIVMASNPSHLESVDSVVEGICKGMQQVHQDTRHEKIIPLLIHGDASLAGQGVIYETLQLSHLAAYDTGGTVHLIINNQIGFTTNPEASRSTKYCTDIAKSFGFPVFHVNVEDVEMCVWAMISAFELRQKFHIDVFVELNCYRKHGHNESDEPAFTQPLMYDSIRKKKSVKTQYLEALCQEGFTLDELMQFDDAYKQKLALAFEDKKNFLGHIAPSIKKPKLLRPVSIDVLQQYIEELYRVPEQFMLHSRIAKVIEERKKAIIDKNTALIDWSFAETLAFLSILHEGISIRLAGQDSGRGTFSQRHAVWVDQTTGKLHVPLSNNQKAIFEVIDSPLSEYAVLAFEYGYSLSCPNTLVLWEAQFGDFANNAQVIIDQYIAAGEKKWGSQSDLILLLPHGYEGQGPEHSSARMERFLLLCAEDNMTLASPTTPAQYYHLIRRQATYKKPLVVFTPKGLLRHPACKSTPSDLEGVFEKIIVNDAVQKPKRALICQGRIYYDLCAYMQKINDLETAIVRIEQLYPFPATDLKAALPIVSRYIFVQEEPENAGAYIGLKDRIAEILPSGKQLEFRCRKASATPAIGSHTIHDQELHELLESIFKELI